MNVYKKAFAGCIQEWPIARESCIGVALSKKAVFRHLTKGKILNGSSHENANSCQGFTGRGVVRL